MFQASIDVLFFDILGRIYQNFMRLLLQKAIFDRFLVEI